MTDDGSPLEGERAFSISNVVSHQHEHATLGDAHRANPALICPMCESDKLVAMPDGSVRCRWSECGARFKSLDEAAIARAGESR